MIALIFLLMLGDNELVKLSELIPEQMSGWDNKEPGYMIANSKETYKAATKLINSSKRIYEFGPYDDDKVYVYIFAPATKVGIGWDIKVKDVKVDSDLDGDTLVFDVDFVEPIGEETLTNARARWVCFSVPLSKLPYVKHYQMSYVVKQRKAK